MTDETGAETSAEGQTNAPTPKETTKKRSTKKATTKKPASKKSTTKKSTTKKSTTKKPAGKKTTTKKAAEKKPAKDPPKRSSKKTSKKSSGARDDGSTEIIQAIPQREGRVEMIVNSVPGEDCRIAITEDGKLEEFFSEHTARASRVGNIYAARVTNVEASIQAAFVDFGGEENAFLHITDLHPQYFNKSKDKTEQVGRKTPHRQRPPIQEALKRGQEITVQILKEGVGTKGPSVTSYLSIPGRFIVMMPGMDNIGVSRKEEDDDKRRAAKQILSGLDLPEGFGFILRTAGFDRTKTELKRDLAYLKRLWSDMEKRRGKGNRPRLLYTESDLLLRTIRDLLTSDFDRVVIDSESALRRVARFIKIAAPRTHTKLLHYTGSAPIFHAFDIERQIEAIHAREVPLPSGGALVIDQTEALVAIDVNSGKSRGARNAEANAVTTNLEACDAICRQLRLRDMGGLVVCDLIDMRHASNRKEVENRFKERLRRDRAKSTTAPISPFGLLELTRQRMRGSMESQHFAQCPTCRGRGLVQRPGSVADTALRELSALIDHPKVHRVELVVNPRVASELLSTRRSSMVRTELIANKSVDVRVSDSLPLDRFSLYAYEKDGSDLDTEKLMSKHRPEMTVTEWADEDGAPDAWAVDPREEVDETTMLKLAEEFTKRAEQAEEAALAAHDLPDEDEEPSEPAKGQRKKRRRRARKNSDNENSKDSDARESGDDDTGEQETPGSETDPDEDTPKKKRRRRGRRGGRKRRKQGEGSGSEQGGEAAEGSDDDPDSDPADPASSGDAPHERAPKKKPSRPRPVKRDDAASEDADGASKPESGAEPKPKPRRRGLYAGARRKLTASEVASVERDS